MNPALTLSVISLALCIVLFIYFRWYIKQRIADDERLADYKLEVQRLIGEIDTITDRDALLVEERIKILRELLEDTDKRISVYIRELERSRSAETLYASLGQGPDCTAAEDENTKADHSEAPSMSSDTPPKPSDTSPKLSETRDIRMQIAELSLQGFNAARIASKLKISVSEVELALSFLRK